MLGNIKKYYLFSILVRLTFYSPVFVLIITGRGITLPQVFIIQSAHSLGALLLEVPCGAFADKYSKRLSLVIGSILWGITLIAYGVAGNFISFIIWAIIGGIGQAFMSGADSALLHESLTELDRDQEFNKISGRSKSYYTLAGIISTALSGFIAAISLPFTLFISGFFVLLSSITAMRFEVPKVDIDLHKKTIPQIIKRSWNTLRKSKELLWLSFFFAGINGIIWTANLLTQPYLKLVGFPLEYFGLLFAAFALVTAIASFMIHKVKWVNSNWLLLGMVFILFISLFLISSFPGILIFSLWVFFEIFEILSGFLVTSRTLKLVEKSDATTVLSLQSLLLRLFNIVLSLIMGALGTIGTLDSMKFISALLLGLFILLLITNFSIKNRKI